MLKRLFSSNEFEKTFTDCKVDKSHDLVSFKKITDLARIYFKGSNESSKNVNININIQNNISNNINIHINNHHGEKEESKEEHRKNKKKQEILQVLIKKIRSSSEVLRIKGLIAAHMMIKKCYHSQLMDLVCDEIDKYIMACSKNQQHEKPVKMAIKIQNPKQEFIQRHIISFYCQYLKRFILNNETFRFAEAYLQDQIFEGSTIELINKGFVILNLINYILESQYTFNKMGRYYIEHNEIINLFIVYLNDLIVYNAYIKLISKLCMKNMKHASSEEAKHYFLFITESQKSSDRLYQFFYNRYYYSKVKKLLELPTFLTIQSEEYKALVSHVKKIDKNLVVLVKQSKYAHLDDRKINKTSASFATEENDNISSLNKTEMIHSFKKHEESVMQYIGMPLFKQKKKTYKELDDLIINNFDQMQFQNEGMKEE